MPAISFSTDNINYRLIRRILYTALVVWVISVRMLGIDPLGLRQLITIAWLFDAITLYVIALIVWHLWPYRPQK